MGSLHNQLQLANSLLHFVKETNNIDMLAEFQVPTSDPNSTTPTPASSIIVDAPALPVVDLNKEPLSIFDRLKGTSSS